MTLRTISLPFLLLLFSATTEVNAEKSTPEELALIRMETPQAVIVLAETIVAGMATGHIMIFGTLSMPEDDAPMIVGMILPITASVAIVVGGGAAITAAKVGCKIEKFLHEDVEFPGWGGVLGAGAVAGSLVAFLAFTCYALF